MCRPVVTAAVIVHPRALVTLCWDHYLRQHGLYPLRDHCYKCFVESVS